MVYSDELMQDWPRWLREELIDYIEPMLYEKNNEIFYKLVQDFLGNNINKEESSKNKIPLIVLLVTSSEKCPQSQDFENGP